MTADGELPLAGKLTVRAGGRKVILVKRARESERHVLLKALVFGLYVDRYPELTVEPRIRHRHRPDVVALGPDGRPSFWAECGETGKQKLEHLVRAFPGTHLVVAKQVANPAPYEAMIRAALDSVRRSAPVDLVEFPPDAARFIADDGEIAIAFDDVQLRRFA